MSPWSFFHHRQWERSKAKPISFLSALSVEVVFFFYLLHWRKKDWLIWTLLLGLCFRFSFEGVLFPNISITWSISVPLIGLVAEKKKSMKQANLCIDLCFLFRFLKKKILCWLQFFPKLSWQSTFPRLCHIQEWQALLFTPDNWSTVGAVEALVLLSARADHP